MFPKPSYLLHDNDFRLLAETILAGNRSASSPAPLLPLPTTVLGGCFAGGSAAGDGVRRRSSNYPPVIANPRINWAADALCKTSNVKAEFAVFRASQRPFPFRFWRCRLQVLSLRSHRHCGRGGGVVVHPCGFSRQAPNRLVECAYILNSLWGQPLRIFFVKKKLTGSCQFTGIRHHKRYVLTSSGNFTNGIVLYCNLTCRQLFPNYYDRDTTENIFRWGHST